MFTRQLHQEDHAGGTVEGCFILAQSVKYISAGPLATESMMREFSARDVPRIRAITEHTLRENYPTSLYLDIYNWWREGFLVVEDQGQVVGFLAGVMSAPGRARVLMLAVDEKHRNQGYGTVLLNEFIRRAATRGVKAIELEVRRSNIAAIRFYERLGFQVLHPLPKFYTDGEDGIKMGREL